MGMTIRSEVGENLDLISTRLPRSNRKGILDRRCDPESPLVVEGDVHRLVDLGLGSHKLDVEPFGQAKQLAFVLG